MSGWISEYLIQETGSQEQLGRCVERWLGEWVDDGMGGWD